MKPGHNNTLEKNYHTIFDARTMFVQSLRDVNILVIRVSCVFYTIFYSND